MPAAPQSSLPGIPTPAPKVPVSPKAITATMEECWEALCKENSELSETDMQSKWFAIIAEKFPNVNQTDLKPEQYADFLVELG